jgi:hypothetical protein
MTVAGRNMTAVKEWNGAGKTSEKMGPDSRWNEEPRKDERTGSDCGGTRNAKLE